MKTFSLCLALTLLFSACSEERTEQSPTLASRSQDSIKQVWNKPQEAVLCIRIDSERATDKLLRVTVQGKGGEEMGSVCLDRLLAHPFERDFVVAPDQFQSDLYITASINGEEHVARTIVPHLLESTRTKINLCYESGRLRILSSWIEDAPGGARTWQPSADSIQVGYYLLEDGRVVADRQPEAVACVIETDGVHGTAVALSDEQGTKVFSTQSVTTGCVCPTLDGTLPEGYLYPVIAEADSTYLVHYKPGCRLPDSCALSYRPGWNQCDTLRLRQTVLMSDDMLGTTVAKRGSYIPSISELTNLYFFLRRGYDRYGYELHGFGQMSGAYLSSTESSEATAYCIDFSRGTITGSSSKRFSAAKVRLFYIF